VVKDKNVENYINFFHNILSKLNETEIVYNELSKLNNESFLINSYLLYLKRNETENIAFNENSISFIKDLENTLEKIDNKIQEKKEFIVKNNEYLSKIALDIIFQEDKYTCQNVVYHKYDEIQFCIDRAITIKSRFKIKHLG
jgi:hypothetical protein